jgi:hypothetical protein
MRTHDPRRGRHRHRHRQRQRRRCRFIAGFIAIVIATATVAPRLVRAQAVIGANFAGGAGANILLEPPDTMGAPGIDHYVQFVNGRFSIYNKSTGGQISSVTSLTFWNGAGVTFGASDSRSDPRIFFDPTVNRWFASQIDVVGGSTGNTNNFLLAVSNTADPTQGFKAFRFGIGSNFGDFDTMGVNADGVYLSTNNFALNAGNTTPPTNTTVVSIPKADLLLATPTIANRTQFTAESLNNEGNVVQPAIHFGPSVGREALLGMSNTGTTELRRTSVFNAAQQTPGVATLSASSGIAIPPAPNPPVALQQGGTGTLDSIDNRLAQVIQVGTTLWAAQGTNVGGRAGIQWYKIDQSTNTVLQTGTIGGAGFDCIAPSIAANANGAVVIGYTRTASDTFPSAYASVGTTSSGGVTSFAPAGLLKAGAAGYSGSRWGDYSATYTDPADPGIFWTNQEWATTGVNNWATQMSELVVNSPGEWRWRSAANGNFTDANSWFLPNLPRASSQVIFSRATPGTGYTVAMPALNSTITRLSVRQGNVTLSFGGGGTLNVINDVTIGEFDGSPTLTLSGGALSAATLNVDRGGVNYQSGTINITGTIAIADGARVQLTAGRDKTLRAGGVSIAPAGKLDLADNNMIVDYSGASPIAPIRSLIAQGFMGGPWTGGGITSSAAAATAASAHHTALGYAEAAALGSTSFAGQTVDDSSVMIRYTLAGDGNLDGTVDLTDFTFLAANFNGTGKTWLEGDFNYDAIVDLTDFTFLASNFNQSLTAGGGSPGSPIPEPLALPTAATLLLFGSVVARRNHQRRPLRSRREFR